MRTLYLVLAIVGFALPYYFFASFLMKNGFDLVFIINQLFANDISTFFAVDLIITAGVILGYMFREAGRYRMNNSWFYLVATLVVGPSFALPIFLYFREERLERAQNRPA